MNSDAFLFNGLFAFYFMNNIYNSMQVCVCVCLLMYILYIIWNTALLQRVVLPCFFGFIFFRLARASFYIITSPKQHTELHKNRTAVTKYIFLICVGVCVIFYSPSEERASQFLPVLSVLCLSTRGYLICPFLNLFKSTSFFPLKAR